MSSLSLSEPYFLEVFDNRNEKNLKKTFVEKSTKEQ